VTTDQFTPTISDGNLTPTGTDGLGTTSATAPAASASSNVSAGTIVGAVAGTLVGLALLGFLIAFLFRRYRQSRRRSMRDSDFGTFRRSMFAPRSAALTPDMAESDHNATPSLGEPYIPYPATAAQPPSRALAAAAAATAASGGSLQERPKYVYGQDPSHAYQQWQHDDVASDIAHGGAYSSQPQVQSAYNAEAYGSYAKYEDVGHGVVGGVPAGTAMYQDAQRAYQGQQGYDQEYAAYNYSTQHQAYAMGSNGAQGDAYNGI
jgi:predicted lipid-binding transport protein (Tim44 family)